MGTPIKCVLTILVLLSGLAGAQDVKVDSIVVYKGERKMVLIANGKEVKRYRVALGTQQQTVLILNEIEA